MKIMKNMFLMLSLASVFATFQFDAMAADRAVRSRSAVNTATSAGETKTSNQRLRSRGAVNSNSVTQSQLVGCSAGKVYCEPGNYKMRGSSKCDTICEKGYECPGGCYESTYTTTSGRFKCEKNMFSDGKGTKKCSECKNGTVLTETIAGSVLNTGCRILSVGNSGGNGLTLVDSGSGTERPTPGNGSTPVGGDSGTSRPTSSDGFTPVGNGTSSSGSGFVQGCQRNQVYCEPGKYVTDRLGANCNTVCPAGYACPGGCVSIGYNSGFGREKCTGRNFSNAGWASCDKCPTNARLITENDLNIGCDFVVDSGNSGSGTGNNGREDDFQNPNGMISCQKGEYLPGNYATRCVKCLAGYYCPNAGKYIPGEQPQGITPCSDGWISSGGADKCTKCGSGLISNSSHTGCITSDEGRVDGGSTQRVITYECTNGTGGQRSDTQNVVQGNAVTIRSNEPWCKRDGWTFDKWQSDHNLTNESGNGTATYNANQTITYKYNGNARLNATWTKNNNNNNNNNNNQIESCMVTYDCGNGKNEIYEVEERSPFTVPGGDRCEEPDNEEFKNWYVKDGTGTYLDAGQGYRCTKESFVILAEWQRKEITGRTTHQWDTSGDVKTHTVTYRCGSCGDEACQTQTDTATADQDYTIPNSIMDYMVNHTKSGYTFVGWNVRAGKEEATVPDTWTLTSNRTVYAACQKIPTPGNYKITYTCPKPNVNSTMTGSVPSNTNVTVSQSYQLANNTCAYAGYSFDKWNCNYNLGTGASGNTNYNANASGTFNVNHDVACVATWTANKYNVTYNKGINATSDSTNYVHEEGATFGSNYSVLSFDDLSSHMSAKDGWVFAGWTTDANPTFTNDVLDHQFTGMQPWTKTSDLTVYAAYIQQQHTECNVTYNCGGSSTTPSQNRVYTEVPFTAEDNFCVPTSNTQEFDYWQPSDDTNAKVPNNNVWTYNSCGTRGTLTFTAHWKTVVHDPEDTYTITYVCDGGTGNPEVQTVANGDNVNIHPNTVCDKDGKTFTHWVKSGDSTVKFKAGDSYEWSFGDLTLKPDWQDATGDEVECEKGKYLPKKTSQNPSCNSVCPAGYFCPGGKYEPSTIKSEGIFECGDGEYQDKTGQSECITCDGTVSADRKTCDTGADDGTETVTTITEGIPVVCDAGTWLPKGYSKCSSCLEGYFCPGGKYKTSSTEPKGIYTCLNGGKTNYYGTACTVTLDSNDLLYGINREANCWLEKAPEDYKGCVFNGAHEVKVGE